ncbi:uncharacterized protein B0H64DRAFT_78967 [Chaetomium fimeti]|uniref:Chitin-binding type-2 domain-containing protein n=1 Tax=Chaetomium fimeti TaxID=1854472 RepID=A0AAE0HL93_9PEZI|nr:hypothetical protein B0H64DRAFT_78967 [Chaetomium fimeti]
MQFLSLLALAAAATAAVMPNAAEPNAAAPLAVDEQAQPAAAAPQADAAGGAEAAGAAGANHYWPPPPPTECRPGTYSCTTTNKGFRVCDYSGHWVYGGPCPWNQVCKMNWQNQSPYCVPRYH